MFLECTLSQALCIDSIPRSCPYKARRGFKGERQDVLGWKEDEFLRLKRRMKKAIGGAIGGRISAGRRMLVGCRPMTRVARCICSEASLYSPQIILAPNYPSIPSYSTLPTSIVPSHLTPLPTPSTLVDWSY